MQTKRQRIFMVLFGLVVLGLWAQFPTAQAMINLNVFTDPYTLGGLAPGGTIGFAYAGDKFVGSVYNSGNNVLYSSHYTGGG